MKAMGSTQMSVDAQGIATEKLKNIELYATTLLFHNLYSDSFIRNLDYILGKGSKSLLVKYGRKLIIDFMKTPEKIIDRFIFIWLVDSNPSWGY